MAKAQFHKNQKVFVKTVGTWAIVEKVMPQWAKGIDEPIRVYYDLGLGRDFAGEELQAEVNERAVVMKGAENWRVIRARNKAKPLEECANHPYPGTHPTVVTNEADWGGWRVPAAEYDLHPERIEYQARMLANAPKMLMILRTLVNYAKIESDLPPEIATLTTEATAILRYIDQEIHQ